MDDHLYADSSRKILRGELRTKSVLQKRHRSFFDGVSSPEVVNQHALADSNFSRQLIQAQVERSGPNESAETALGKVGKVRDLSVRHLISPMYHVVHSLKMYHVVHLILSGKAAHENARLYPPVRPRLYRLDSRFGLLCLSRSFRSRDYEPALLDQLLHLASSERGPLHRYSQTTSRPTHRMGVRNAPARYSWDDWRGSRSLSSIDIHAKDSRLIGR